MKWLALVLCAGCAGRMGEIVSDPGDLAEAAGAPEIETVSELGGGDVMLTGPVVPPQGDDFATVGEALWVRGQSFGRLPTVTIAGRPAAVLARTTDAGVIVRVPPAAAAGPRLLTITNDRGHSDFLLTVRRLVVAMPPGGGRLAFAVLDSEGLRATGEIEASGRLMRVGSDGRAAYVLDPSSLKLTVIELPAEGGPRAAYTVAVAQPAEDNPVVAFVAAAQAQSLLVLRAHDLVMLDASSSLHPVRGQPRALPAALAKGVVTAAALSPDGRQAAVALESGNRIALVDLQRGGVASSCEVALAPDARVPVLVDVSFAPDGHTLWAVLGDTAKSRPVGPQPTEIAAVRIEPGAGAGGAPTLVVARRVRIDEAEAPVRLSAGRALPLASGASIRLPPERATVYLTASARSGAATVFRLGPEDRATAFVEVPGVAGPADLSPDGRWLMVPVVSPQGRLGIVAAPADDRPGERRTVDLGSAGGGAATGASRARSWLRRSRYST